MVERYRYTPPIILQRLLPEQAGLYTAVACHGEDSQRLQANIAVVQQGQRTANFIVHRVCAVNTCHICKQVAV